MHRLSGETFFINQCLKWTGRHSQPQNPIFSRLSHTCLAWECLHIFAKPPHSIMRWRLTKHSMISHSGRPQIRPWHCCFLNFGPAIYSNVDFFTRTGIHALAYPPTLQQMDGRTLPNPKPKASKCTNKCLVSGWDWQLPLNLQQMLSAQPMTCLTGTATTTWVGLHQNVSGRSFTR